jgi:hypothetical protein
MQIQWIEVAYNTSSQIKKLKTKRDGIRSVNEFGPFESSPHLSAKVFEGSNDHSLLESRTDSKQDCKVVCNIDGGTNAGTPVVSIAGCGPDLSWLLILVLALGSISKSIN